MKSSVLTDPNDSFRIFLTKELNITDFSQMMINRILLITIVMLGRENYNGFYQMYTRGDINEISIQNIMSQHGILIMNTISKFKDKYIEILNNKYKMNKYSIQAYHMREYYDYKVQANALLRSGYMYEQGPGYQLLEQILMQDFQVPKSNKYANVQRMKDLMTSIIESGLHIKDFKKRYAFKCLPEVFFNLVDKYADTIRIYYYSHRLLIKAGSIMKANKQALIESIANDTNKETEDETPSKKLLPPISKIFDRINTDSYSFKYNPYIFLNKQPTVRKIKKIQKENIIE